MLPSSKPQATEPIIPKNKKKKYCKFWEWTNWVTKEMIEIVAHMPNNIVRIIVSFFCLSKRWSSLLIKFWSNEFTEAEAIDYHNSFIKTIFIETFKDDAVGNFPSNWKIDSGTFVIAEDSTSKYISCTGNGTITFSGLGFSGYNGNGFIKKLTGDLVSDEGGTVDAATNVSFTNSRLTLTMTSGQKVRDIVIKTGERQWVPNI